MKEKAIVMLFLLLVDISVSAQNTGALKGFYGSINLGTGIVNGNITNYEIQTTPQFAMHFNIGYFLNRSLQAGVTGCGWLFESYLSTRTEERGESLSNAMVHVLFYPGNRSRFFIKGGFGVSKYKNNRPENDNGKGSALLTAVGFEDSIGLKNFIGGIQLSYQYGKLKYGYLYTPATQQNRKFHVLDLTLFIGLD